MTRESVLQIRPTSNPGVIQHIAALLTLAVVIAITLVPVAVYHYLTGPADMSTVALPISARFTWLFMIVLTLGNCLRTANGSALRDLLIIVIVLAFAVELISATPPGEDIDSDPVIARLALETVPKSGIRVFVAWVGYMLIYRIGKVESAFGFLYYAGTAGAMVGALGNLHPVVRKLYLIKKLHGLEQALTSVSWLETVAPVWIHTCAALIGAPFVALQLTTQVAKRTSFAVLSFLVPWLLVGLFDVSQCVSDESDGWLAYSPCFVVGIASLLVPLAIRPIVKSKK